MSGLKNYDIDPADLDPNGIVESQTVTAGNPLVLNGTLCDAGTALQFDISDGYSAGIGGIKLLFDAAGDINTAVFTITGKDQDGKAITEAVTGVTTTAVSTTKYYSQVTVIDITVATATNCFVGTVTGELSSRTIPINNYSQVPATVAATGLSGTIEFNLQETYENVLADGPTGAEWFNVVSRQTTDVSSQCSFGATAVRCILNSYSNGAELQFKVSYTPYR